MNQFKNRVFGCVIVKSINSNYNADFSHQPRTLPNGIVYATDKALKYAIKNYLKDVYPDEKIFYFKRFRSIDFIPFSLMEAFSSMFPELGEIKDPGTDKEKVKLKASKKQVGSALLKCLDIKLFGATFAMKGGSKEENLAMSIHGPVQINHGVNIWRENNIYSEQIMSPFRNPDEKSEDKEATTLGRQSKLQEGHYLHHFSINPNNLNEIVKLAEDENLNLNDKNIDALKDAFCKGVTYYDSASKAGTDNEFLLWIKLSETSKTVLPNFTQLVKLDKTNEGKIEIDLFEVNEISKKNDTDIETIEIYYLPENIILKNEPVKKTKKFDLTSGNEIK